jgi:cardiolipin synthase
VFRCGSPLVKELDTQALALEPDTHLQLLAERALARTGGAPLIAGNAVRILKDSTENFPAWMEAIERARKFILFENYIIANDEIGQQFVAALAAKARQGVRVRLIYDFGGSLVSSRLFAPLVAAGAEVRCFNPPRLDSPLGWLMRDHRKMVAVDGEVAFITGLCVARRWMGHPARGIPPWRDTGVEVRGPAVAEIERAFAQAWKAAGPALPEAELTAGGAIAPVGQVTVMVVATEPTSAGLYRLDQFIATVARRTLWLTDAYYVGTPAYVEALRAAARDGVDVRILVPGSSDLPITQAFSRAGYRPLLEAGIRVFEWNGSMLHAKTAVADGRWSRVGSSNLNLSSWLANYELDLAVYDKGFGRQMDEMYLADLEQATEIVLRERNRVRPVREARPPQMTPVRGSASRAAASALRIGNTVNAALTNRRILGPSEAGLMFKVGLVLLVMALLGIVWPEVVAVPVGLFAGWVGIALVIRAWRLRKGTPEEADGAKSAEEGRQR